jgi:TIR domain/SIR2-like domain
MMSRLEKTVFISYAHEDSVYAERLYNDLKHADLSPWRDKDAIRVGLNWKIAIRKAIKNSRYFIPLFSSNSVEKIGYVQKEFKYAIDNFDKFPESQIYIIPARLDDCQIPYEKLEDIQYVDLFPDWDKGVNQIFEAMGVEVRPEKEVQENEVDWRMGLSDKDWKDLLISICKKKCIPFVGQGAYTLQSQDGKTLIPLSKDIIDKWKEKYRYPLEDLYALARVYTLEDSYQLARLAQFLEIETADVDEMYPKTMLSEMLKELDLSNFPSQTKSSYDILANLDLPIYITTNHDRFLERALSGSPGKKPESDFCKWSDKLIKYVDAADISSVFDETQYKPTQERPLVYHIHGDMNTPESMVLTERDYFEFVINLNKNDEKDMLPPIIRTELATSSLLFIGYTLEDINFRAIFQGFLSFLSSIDKKYRKFSVAIQIPPIISNKGQAKMQKYLEQYTRNMFDVHIFWGTTYDFITELDKRWKDFEQKNDMKTCLPLKGI